MKIRRIIQMTVPPPPEIEMQFSRDDGWAVLGALNEWVARHPDAAGVVKWTSWANALDRELRR